MPGLIPEIRIIGAALTGNSISFVTQEGIGMLHRHETDPKLGESSRFEGSLSPALS